MLSPATITYPAGPPRNWGASKTAQAQTAAAVVSSATKSGACRVQCCLGAETTMVGIA
jgi:hypothetical protein